MTGSVLFTIVLTVLWFITGVRDLMGKDPLINLPFNQYNRDPEYRAFWQKKNGIWELANGITFGLSNVLIVFPEARTARTVVAGSDALLQQQMNEMGADKTRSTKKNIIHFAPFRSNTTPTVLNSR